MMLSAFRIFRVSPVNGRSGIRSIAIHLPFIGDEPPGSRVFRNTCTVYSVTVIECRNVRQRAESGNCRGGSDDCGNSHMPAMSDKCFGRCTRRILPAFAPRLSSLLRSTEHHTCAFFSLGGF